MDNFQSNISKPLLVLDLDETLIHASLSDIGREPNLYFDKYRVYKRPGLEKFLTDVHQLFKLAIWSTGSDDYVSEIVKAITPADCNYEFVWGRSRCTARNLEIKFAGKLTLSGIDYVKPLNKVKKLGYPLERILIVDDSVYKCSDNYGNAIYIKAFEGDLNDCELQKLSNYLKQLQPQTDYRKIEKRGWENGSY